MKTERDKQKRCAVVSVCDTLGVYPAYIRHDHTYICSRAFQTTNLSADIQGSMVCLPASDSSLVGKSLKIIPPRSRSIQIFHVNTPVPHVNRAVLQLRAKRTTLVEGFRRGWHLLPPARDTESTVDIEIRYCKACACEQRSGERAYPLCPVPHRERWSMFTGLNPLSHSRPPFFSSVFQVPFFHER